MVSLFPFVMSAKTYAAFFSLIFLNSVILAVYTAVITLTIKALV